MEILESPEQVWLRDDHLPIKLLGNKDREMRHGIYRYEESFVFHGLPLPPSSNNLYSQNKYGHRFKVRAGEDFQRGCQIFHVKFKNQINLASTVLQAYVAKGFALKIDRYFFIESHRILTKKLTPKRLDTSNLIKAPDDELATMIGIDDKFFWFGTEGKVIAHPQSDPFTTLIVGPCKIKDEMSFYEEMSRLGLVEVPGNTPFGVC